jgi:hypothetical protein
LRLQAADGVLIEMAKGVLGLCLNRNGSYLLFVSSEVVGFLSALFKLMASSGGYS